MSNIFDLFRIFTPLTWCAMLAGFALYTSLGLAINAFERRKLSHPPIKRLHVGRKFKFTWAKTFFVFCSFVGECYGCSLVKAKICYFGRKQARFLDRLRVNAAYKTFFRQFCAACLCSFAMHNPHYALYRRHYDRDRATRAKRQSVRRSRFSARTSNQKIYTHNEKPPRRKAGSKIIGSSSMQNCFFLVFF